MLRQPLENAQLTETLVRVAYHLVVIDYRRCPALYHQNAPGSVLLLAERIREHKLGNLYWTLNGCARWLAQGYTLAAWRHEAATAIGVRAFHKRKGSRRR
jgi:hypothetical protein